MPLRIGLQAESCLCQRALFSNASNNISEHLSLWGMVQNVISRNYWYAMCTRKFCHLPDPLSVITAIRIGQCQVKPARKQRCTSLYLSGSCFVQCLGKRKNKMLPF